MLTFHSHQIQFNLTFRPGAFEHSLCLFPFPFLLEAVHEPAGIFIGKSKVHLNINLNCVVMCQILINYQIICSILGTHEYSTKKQWSVYLMEKDDGIVGITSYIFHRIKMFKIYNTDSID
jgi:hypothetical protein